MEVIWEYSLECEYYWKNQYKKEEYHQNSSVFIVLRQLSYYLNITDPLIIPLSFTFLFCHEKAHVNKECSRENSKPHHESQIKTC